MAMHKITVLLVDDHHLVRQGFAALLANLDFVELIGEAGNGLQALQFLRSNKQRPDVILMDVEMPGMGGLEALEQIGREFFGAKVVMITMLNDRDVIQTAIQRGARGFLFKNASPHDLGEAIRRVAAGEQYFAADVTLTLLNAPPKAHDPLLDQLTERELEILRLVAEGLSSTEIGERLFISPRTVDTHRNNLIQKLDVNGIAGLVRFAVQHKLV